MKNIYLSLTLTIASLSAISQDIKVLNGPVLGYAEMREAIVWLQLTESASTYAVYDDLSTTEKEEFRTETVSCSPSTANTVKLRFTEVEPGRKYSYSIYVDGALQEFDFALTFSTEPLWDYRTEPPAFSFAAGSCIYVNESAYDRPGRPYGGDYGIFNEIEKLAPDALLWLGDNTYLREADYFSRTGYLKRYTHSRSIPELQSLMAKSNNYAIWDDHDFGPNDASGSWINRDIALEVFKLFWPNPSFGYRDMPSTFSAFNYRDCDFIMMDNRFYRTEVDNQGEGQIFGQTQIDRMIDILKQSKAPFKFVLSGGQLLNTAKVYENHSNYEEERHYIISRIEEENIRNVIFLTGDRHHSEYSQLELTNGNIIYDFTISPLTSSANKNEIEKNELRVAGSLIQERNFAIGNISGPRKQRVLDFTFYDNKGQVIKIYTIKE
jgi:alkaline phosphatase D